MQKLDYLNGLRGLAALVVVIHHFAYSFLTFSTKGSGTIHFAFEKVIYTTPLQLLVAGNFAVCIFFILSGFVLSYAFFQSGSLPIVQRAAAKRYFRLMPPILGSVLLSWAIVTFGLNYNQGAAAVTGSEWLHNFWPQAVSFGEAIFYGSYDIIAGDASAGLLNNALWTMKVEFFGSLLVFAILALVGKLRWRWAVYLALSLVLWDTYYVAFVLGVALCDFFCLAATRPSWRLRWPFAAALAGVGLILGAIPIPGSTETVYSAISIPGIDPYTFFTQAHIVGALLLLSAIVFWSRLQQLLSLRPFRYLGRISFSLYLLHILVLGSFISYMFTTLHPTLGYKWSMILAGGAYASIAFIAADIYTRYVDEPSIRLASQIGRWVTRSPKSAPQSESPAQPTLISRESNNSSVRNPVQSDIMTS